MAWTSPKTWAVNDILTAGDLNTYVRDNENAVGTLTAYVPTWTAATTNPTIGNGTISGKYVALAEWCWISIQIVAGSTTAGGSGTYSVGLPFAGATLTGEQDFAVTLYNTGVARYLAVAVIPSGGSTFTVNLTGVAAGFWTNSSPFTFAAAGNLLSVSGMYRRV
jgi:hypothetical protein